MSVAALISSSFLKELEEEVITAVGVSLLRNDKVVTAKTIQSIRAETELSGDTISVCGFGSEGLKFIVEGKPANTKYPLDFVGTKTNSKGNTVKVFELKPKLKDWKAIRNFGGSDFMLARAIALNPRLGIDIAEPAIKILKEKAAPKIKRYLGTTILADITNKLDDV